MRGAACKCKYRSISSERQRPSNRITSVSTLAHSSALAPAARRHLAETSEGRNPSDAGVKYVTAARRADVISLGLTAV